uniref:HTH_48 domain-containing protein n=1 Tax=Caenorhabditis japonica TaxID=281687 RepID=A0A8R1HTS8_CAEJA
MNDLSRPQLRLIISYEWSCGTPAAETVTKSGKVFGETTVTDRTVRNWFARFQSGEKCFEDNDRCGYRPEQRTATRSREGEARCNYARVGDHAWLQSPNHQQSSSRSWLPTSAGEMGTPCSLSLPDAGSCDGLSVSSSHSTKERVSGGPCYKG